MNLINCTVSCSAPDAHWRCTERQLVQMGYSTAGVGAQSVSHEAQQCRYECH